jgi:hypothetical protein
LNLDTDIIERDNWIGPTEIDSLRAIVENWQPTPSVPTAGHFANQLVSMQHYLRWSDCDAIGLILHKRLQQIFAVFRVTECVYQELYLPWDIHCDYHRPDVCDAKPWRAILIPLEPADSVTIIFKQTAEYNDFYRYKQSNPRADQPVDQAFWQQYLDFCWPEDREWLTVDCVSKKWLPGYMLSLPRNRLHSSDNFHKRLTQPKRFIQILIDRPCDS